MYMHMLGGIETRLIFLGEQGYDNGGGTPMGAIR